MPLLPGSFSLLQKLATHYLNVHSRPWPYVDSLDEQDHTDQIDEGKLPIIGSCGHDNCDDCHRWYSYPQSQFGNWTIKPVRKCGIEAAVKNKDHPSMIYTVNVLETGEFKEDRKSEVNPKTKREYWNDVLMTEASAHLNITT